LSVECGGKGSLAMRLMRNNTRMYQDHLTGTTQTE
jgi:hypothetical protein